MKLLLKGGTVVSGQGAALLDLLVDGETIAQVGKGLCCPDAKTVDVTGKVLFPRLY